VTTEWTSRRRARVGAPVPRRVAGARPAGTNAPEFQNLRSYLMQREKKARLARGGWIGGAAPRWLAGPEAGRDGLMTGRGLCSGGRLGSQSFGINP